MNVLSLFSGAGGMDRGLEAAGHRIVGMCEIEPKPREVLARHWPHVPLAVDVTKLEGPHPNGPVDLVAGGSPCQDLSVAGRRAGLDGERSGLFWHQCRIAAQVGARWVLWENVAGALSSNGGQDFAAVLWGLTGTYPDVPEDGWRSAGVCVGPERTAVWRLLDARWFGVPQRRRRVFVVSGPRGECGPEILLEPESCGGDSGPRRAPGESVAALTSNGVGTCGPDDNQAQAGHLTVFTESGHGAHYTEGVGSLRASDHKRPEAMPVVSFNWQGSAKQGDDVQTEFTGSLECTRHPAVAISENQRGELVETDYAHQLTTGGGKPGQGYPAVNDGTAVRRLTPRECERLMSWPDDWTRWDRHGNEIADSHRYRMCGNGVVSNVTEWIGRRLP